MPITKDEFRRALGHFASGVTVVCTRDKNGKLHGLTASAFTSVSLDPPLVLVCIDKNTGSYYAFAESGLFWVNVLADDHELISRRFASNGPGKFEGVEHRNGRDGVPVIEGALANLECRIVHSYEGGDHTIFVGQVEAAQVKDGRPLIYFRGGYARLTI
jgi:flavin reductase (DIM6/NTAB) family NADH-FMN oxidoreductase RutF